MVITINNKEKQITRSEIAKTIADLQKYLQDKVQETDARIYSEKHTASEYYLSDMNGYSRRHQKKIPFYYYCPVQRSYHCWLQDRTL